jgi:Tfp pilus assembly protein PilF/SAM-dependent methyltransferase
MDMAVQHLNAGHSVEAESICRQVLQADSAQPVALHLLGVLAQQAGNAERAVELLKQALAANPDMAEAHGSLANAYQDLGQLDAAAGSFRDAIAVMPNLTEAHSNLGNVLRDQGELEAAVASYRKALAINSNIAETHNNLGNALRDLARLDDALSSFHQAIELQPEFAEAHNNLGIALREIGQIEEAFTSHRRAVALEPQNNALWLGFAQSLEAMSFDENDDNLLAELLTLLDHPTVRPAAVVHPIIGALRHHPQLSDLLIRAAADNISYAEVAEQLSAMPLLLRLMALSPIDDLEIEQLFTDLRQAMIADAAAGKLTAAGLPFGAALALHCFVNEYVYPESGQETAWVDQLAAEIAALLQAAEDVPPWLVAALGAYRPLHGFAWAEQLGRCSPGAIGEIITHQVIEPGIDLGQRGQIASLTAIDGAVSQTVRALYEENPYPRWIKTGLVNQGRAIGVVLREAPLRFDLEDYQSPESPEILIAGCGTGQHALVTASRFLNARVLALDLGLSGLAYAVRKTRELGISNIDYAQADIMELAGLGRQFDLIESVGVLHHLGEPIAGWQILTDLLRPGGLMKIGLYSETARQDIVSGRALIAEKAYLPTPEHIRCCRQDIVALAEAGDSNMAKICSRMDFYSMSECRDLLFHPEEHCFTLPEIEAALAALKLKFLGFEMRGSGALRKFMQIHPNPDATTSLTLWHEFELEHPDLFQGMYQFWCRKL